APMVAASIITVASLPIYYALFHALDVVGLAIASDIGIAGNTLALAIMLHRRGVIPLPGLNWRELGKAAVTAVIAAAAGIKVAEIVRVAGSRRADLLSLVLASVTWAGAVAGGLWILRSELPKDLRRKKAQPTAAAVEQGTAADLGAGVEP
ncbi:MAG: hypothetical protein ACXVZT_03145, partial [Terriglobales bacterium]